MSPLSGMASSRIVFRVSTTRSTRNCECRLALLDDRRPAETVVCVSASSAGLRLVFVGRYLVLLTDSTLSRKCNDLQVRENQRPQVQLYALVVAHSLSALRRCLGRGIWESRGVRPRDGGVLPATGESPGTSRAGTYRFSPPGPRITGGTRISMCSSPFYSTANSRLRTAKLRHLAA